MLGRALALQLLHPLVFFHFSVADVDDAVSVQGDIVLVGHQHNGITLRVEALEQSHDFVAGSRVQVSGGLISQQDGRVIHQSTGNRYALPRAA